MERASEYQVRARTSGVCTLRHVLVRSILGAVRLIVVCKDPPRSDLQKRRLGKGKVPGVSVRLMEVYETSLKVTVSVGLIARRWFGKAPPAEAPERDIVS